MATSSSLPELPPNYQKALELIDEAHRQDPRPSAVESVPFELDYAQKMTRWLAEL
ncbi:glutamyl-tRNA synthetase [Colletotrichum higginsianum]|uniref:Glutamyl-tRNA synthetase n=1 Tax=Colletotrichum higginsianum (strain IMI 349063) TaxID=759273 RepID=H1VDF7_COLHI|nr:glutamyl-tRNA synthetase [Colletotrichum higginsianum]